MNNESVWHVLHVRPRCEKKVAEYLAVHTVEHYLALREEAKVYQRRRVLVHKPVFPGYVFAVFTPEQRVLVLKSNQIARIIAVQDQRRLVHELQQVRRALTVDPTLGACEAFRQGRYARIKTGPFQGLEGVVATQRGQTRVILNVEMIGQAVAVEIDINQLESVD